MTYPMIGSRYLLRVPKFGLQAGRVGVVDDYSVGGVALRVQVEDVHANVVVSVEDLVRYFTHIPVVPKFVYDVFREAWDSMTLPERVRWFARGMGCGVDAAEYYSDARWQELGVDQRCLLVGYALQRRVEV